MEGEGHFLKVLLKKEEREWFHGLSLEEKGYVTC